MERGCRELEIVKQKKQKKQKQNKIHVYYGHKKRGKVRKASLSRRRRKWTKVFDLTEVRLIRFRVHCYKFGRHNKQYEICVN